MPANRGPVPKLSAERRRTNKESGEAVSLRRGTFEIPEAPEDWHAIAYNWYVGLETSGQSVLYEQSDWDLAYILGENLSRMLKPQFVGFGDEFDEASNKMLRVPTYALRHIAGGDFTAILKAMSMLMVTETERRRMHVELANNRIADIDAAEAAVDDARASLGLVG